MVTDKMKELHAARAKLASLEKAIAAEMNKELAGLPVKFGFDSVADFVRAVTAASGGRKSSRRSSAAKKGKGRRRRTRAVITDETRAQVKKLVDAGKTGGEIAAALKISVPSVQNIKKALGLVKGR